MAENNINQGTEVTSQMPTLPEPVITNPVPPQTTPTNTKKKLGLATIIIGLLVVLGGGSAAAYYGVVVPNQPQNVIKAASKKLIKSNQQTMSTKGKLTVDMNGDSSPLKNVTVNFTTGSDASKKSFFINLDTSVSGVKIPVEIRALDQNIYFKFGNLNSLKSMAVLSEPSMAPTVELVSSKLSNQWVEVDESFLKQANMGCTFSVSSLSDSDVDQIIKVYSNNQFTKVVNKRPEKIDGRDTTRYELKLDNQKTKAFASQIKNVPAIKKLNECSNNASNNKPAYNIDDASNLFLDGTDFIITVWIDKSKTYRQIQIDAKDKDSKTSTSLIITPTNEVVNILKPDGAKPLTEVMGDLSALLGGASGLQPGNQSNAPSAACIEAYRNMSESEMNSGVPAACR